MLNEQTLLRLPHKCKNYTIYPPSVNDMVGNDKSWVYKKILTMSQEDIEDLCAEEAKKDINSLLNEPIINSVFLTPLEMVLNQAYNSSKIKKITIEAFQFFIHEPVTFLFEQKKILIGDINKDLLNISSLKDLRFLDENNFLEFQNDIRAYAFGEKAISPPNPNEDPRIKRAKALGRIREKVKLKTKKGVSLSTSLISICCMNLGINLLNIGEISYASVPYLINYYQEKTRYEYDIEALLHGADSKKVNPTTWIKDIDN